jgi:hypothetical protein
MLTLVFILTHILIVALPIETITSNDGEPNIVRGKRIVSRQTSSVRQVKIVRINVRFWAVRGSYFLEVAYAIHKDLQFSMYINEQRSAL